MPSHPADPFFDARKLDLPDPHLGAAGALDCFDGLLAIGGYGGRLLGYSWPDLAPQQLGVPAFASSCHSVHVGRERVLWLGTERAIATETAPPRDWKNRIAATPRHDSRAGARLELPAGNWRGVQGPSRDTWILNDVSEGQGLLAVDVASLTVTSSISLPSVHHARPTARRSLIAITRDGPARLLELRADSLGVLSDRELPCPDEYTWNCALAFDDERILLGGTRAGDGRYVIASWSLADFVHIVTTTAVDEQFTPTRIAHAREDDDTCGFDLNRVADLVWLETGRLVACAFGGEGEGLGACHSACSVAVLDLATGTLASLRLDDESGCSNMFRTADGALIVDCGGSVYVLRPRT